MPYAIPLPSTSAHPPSTAPTSSPLQGDANGRPLRRHMRSHSTDNLSSSTSPFIFLQASPPLEPLSSLPSPGSTGTSMNASRGKGNQLSTSAVKKTLARVYGVESWKEGDDCGPSSQEESPTPEEGDRDERYPGTGMKGMRKGQPPLPAKERIQSTSFSFGETPVAPFPAVRLVPLARPTTSSNIPLVPIPNATSSPYRPSPSHHQKSASSPNPSFSSSPSIYHPPWSTHRGTTMIRKKSGELVRSSLKMFGLTPTPSPAILSESTSSPGTITRRAHAKSAPATPVCPKYVHFDTQLEHVKHFLAQQRPAAVSRSGSPVDTETEDEGAVASFPFPAMTSPGAGTISLVLPNFPISLDRSKDCYVETLEVSADGKVLKGIVRVRNTSFEKWVAVRFTLDDWSTVSEVSAEHVESMGAESDRFEFSIRLQDLLARIEEKTLFLAVRYRTPGKEVWDNNEGKNYEVHFHKKRPTTKPLPPTSSLSTSTTSPHRHSWSVTNIGQANDRMADIRRQLDRLVSDDENGSSVMPPPPPSHHHSHSHSHSHSHHLAPATLANRYDFKTASLKLSSATNGNGNGNGNGNASSSRPLPLSSGTGTSSPPTPVNLHSGVVVNGSTEEKERTSPLLPPHHLQGGRSPSSLPSEKELASLYSGYQNYSVSQSGGGRARYPTNYHGSGSSSSSTTTSPCLVSALSLTPTSSTVGAGAGAGFVSYPLLPPSFRDSPFASPCESPVDAGSPPRKRSSTSPPLYPTVSPTEERLWSPPNSSLDNISAETSLTSSTYSSPDLELATKRLSLREEVEFVDLSLSGMGGGGGGGSALGLAGTRSPADLATFLDRYCFHTSSTTSSSLGLSTPDYGLSTSVLSTHDFSTSSPRHFLAAVVAASSSTTSSSTSSNGGGGYFAAGVNEGLHSSGSTASGGTSTPTPRGGGGGRESYFRATSPAILG